MGTFLFISLLVFTVCVKSLYEVVMILQMMTAVSSTARFYPNDDVVII